MKQIETWMQKASRPVDKKPWELHAFPSPIHPIFVVLITTGILIWLNQMYGSIEVIDGFSSPDLINVLLFVVCLIFFYTLL
jgi:hypothetical protein